MVAFTQLLRARVPANIAQFQWQVVNDLPLMPVAGGIAVAHQLCCQCGQSELFLEAAQHRVDRGVCVKTPVLTLAPPVYIKCPTCKS